MKEKGLLNNLLLKLPPNIRMFRNNVGRGWVGKLVSSKQTTNNGLVVTLSQARVLNAGLIKGSTDLIGWTTVKITPEMVGKEIAVFTALEGKTGRTVTSSEQKTFIRNVNEKGGIAIVFHDENTPLSQIEKWTPNK